MLTTVWSNLKFPIILQKKCSMIPMGISAAKKIMSMKTVFSKKLKRSSILIPLRIMEKVWLRHLERNMPIQPHLFTFRKTENKMSSQWNYFILRISSSRISKQLVFFWSNNPTYFSIQSFRRSLTSKWQQRKFIYQAHNRPFWKCHSRNFYFRPLRRQGIRWVLSLWWSTWNWNLYIESHSKKFESAWN